jgi:hypothetical protein
MTKRTPTFALVIVALIIAIHAQARSGEINIAPNMSSIVAQTTHFCQLKVEPNFAMPERLIAQDAATGLVIFKASKGWRLTGSEPICINAPPDHHLKVTIGMKATDIAPLN